MTEKEEIKYWKTKYEFQYQSWLSLRNLYNKEIRENNLPDIRMIKAKLADQSRK